MSFGAGIFTKQRYRRNKGPLVAQRLRPPSTVGPIVGDYVTMSAAGPDIIVLTLTDQFAATHDVTLNTTFASLGIEPSDVLAMEGNGVVPFGAVTIDHTAFTSLTDCAFSGCGITAFTIGNGINALELSSNQLTAYPSLPPTLTGLSMSENPFFDAVLPVSLPASLTSFSLSGCNLTPSKVIAWLELVHAHAVGETIEYGFFDISANDQFEEYDMGYGMLGLVIDLQWSVSASLNPHPVSLLSHDGSGLVSWQINSVWGNGQEVYIENVGWAVYAPVGAAATSSIVDSSNDGLNCCVVTSSDYGIGAPGIHEVIALNFI